MSAVSLFVMAVLGFFSGAIWMDMRWTHKARRLRRQGKLLDGGPTA